MKKLSENYAGARDLLLQLAFDIAPVEQDSDWSYNRSVGNSRHNYDRDREISLGKFLILYKGVVIARLQLKPHKSIVLKRHQGQLRLMRNVLDKAVRDYIPGIKVSYKNYV